MTRVSNILRFASAFAVTAILVDNDCKIFANAVHMEDMEDASSSCKDAATLLLCLGETADLAVDSSSHEALADDLSSLEAATLLHRLKKRNRSDPSANGPPTKKPKSRDDSVEMFRKRKSKSYQGTFNNG